MKVPFDPDLAFDPHAVPVNPAATVMLVDDRPDLHVLLVRRTANMVFAPDAWVFPGGRVDPGDHAAELEQLCVGLTDAEAARTLRIGLGRFTSAADIDDAAAALIAAHEGLAAA